FAGLAVREAVMSDQAQPIYVEPSVEFIKSLAPYAPWRTDPLLQFWRDRDAAQLFSSELVSTRVPNPFSLPSESFPIFTVKIDWDIIDGLLVYWGLINEAILRGE